MKKYLLIFLCSFLLASCSSTVKNNTLGGIEVSETEMEILPVAADLKVLDQKVTGEVTGKRSDDRDGRFYSEAIAKALGQESPSVDKPDVLVGLNKFTEVDGDNLKLTVTGYPAYYINFRTATKEDSLRLSILNTGARSTMHVGEFTGKPGDEPKGAEGNWYFSIKHTFGDGFGWGLGTGKSYPSDLLQGDIFFGLEVEEMGILSPWKNENDNVDLFGLGGSLNVGGVYGKLPYDLKVVGGLSAGFWYSEAEYEVHVYSPWGGYTDTESDDTSNILVGPFVKVRWHGLEAGIRLLFGSDTDFQFALGFTI